MRTLLISFMLILLEVTPAMAEKVRLAVTSSFHNSGLSDYLIPHIETDLEIDIQLIVVGTGQAIKLGENGDVDAILVHSKPDEEKFVKTGFAKHRRERSGRLGQGRPHHEGRRLRGARGGHGLPGARGGGSGPDGRGAGTGNHRAGRALPAFTKGALRPLHHTHERRAFRRCAGDDDAESHRQALDGI